MNGHSRILRNRIAGIVAVAALALAPTAQADRGHGGHGSCGGSDVTFSWGIGVGTPSAAGPVLYTTFEPLGGYGRWIWMPSFGAHLWFPYVEASWRPYTYGHWIHTRFGMTWVSYEPWGEIPHHYGQWVYFDDFGWGWVPGYEYAPAWVTWAVVDGYVGWAPLPPPGYRYPRYHRYRWDRYPVNYGYRGAFVYHDSGIDFALWVFVSDRDFGGPNVYRHVIPTERTLSLFKHKKVLPVGRSLEVDYVKRVTKGAVPTVPVERKTRSVGGRELVFHEPRGQKERVDRAAADRTRHEITKREGRKDSREAQPPPVKVRTTAPARETPAVKQSAPARKVKEAPKGAPAKRSDKRSAERKTKSRKG